MLCGVDLLHQSAVPVVGIAAEVDLDYLAGSAIAVAREVGERMMARRPVDVAAAADFVVRLIMGGVPHLPRLER